MFLQVDDGGHEGVLTPKAMSRRVLIEYAQIPDPPLIVLPTAEGSSRMGEQQRGFLITREDTAGIIGRCLLCPSVWGLMNPETRVY